MGGLVMTVSACRDQAARCVSEANAEDDAEIRALLLAINNTYSTLADPISQLARLCSAKAALVGGLA